MTHLSNQGSPSIGQVLDDVDSADLQAATGALWAEVHHHHASASCECPTIEALCKLYDLGYRLVKP